MVNKDRIIPVTKVDLLSLYATVINTMLSMQSEPLELKIFSSTVDGKFEITESDFAGICNQPVKAINAAPNIAGMVFFIPDYTYEGIYIDGELVEADGDAVDPSSANLYRAVITPEGATIYAVTPTLG